MALMPIEQAEATSVTDEYAEYREQAGKIGLLDARELHELYENMVQETQGDPWKMEQIARAMGLPIRILHEIAENRERLRQAAEGGGSVDWNRGHLKVSLPRGRPPSKKLLPAPSKPEEQTHPVPLPPRQTTLAPIPPPPPEPEMDNTPYEDFVPRIGKNFVPTDAPPGSDERIEIYAERVRNSFPMYHPKDVDGYDGRTGASGVSKRRIA